VEVGPHRTTDDLGIPEVNGPRQRQHGGGAEGGGGSEDGPHVPRVLDPVQEDEAGPGGERKAVEGALGDIGHGKYTLGRFRLGGARELERRDLGQFHAALAERRQQGGTPGRVDELRRDEGAANGKWGADELLDGADSFGSEQPLALACFPSPEVTC
jgi:hypothetical protein